MSIAITADETHEPHREHKTFMQKVLDGVEAVGNKVPHPVIIFFALIVLVVVLSHIVYLTGASVTYESINAETHEVEMITTGAKSLLSAEGLRFMYADVVKNRAKLGLALTIRPHGIEMGGEREARTVARAGQIDKEVAGLRNAPTMPGRSMALQAIAPPCEQEPIPGIPPVRARHGHRRGHHGPGRCPQFGG